MTNLEMLAIKYHTGKENKALLYASHNCPSDIGLKNEFKCTLEDGSFREQNCVKCWLKEVER